MNGYAPNPSSQKENDYAPLTASLLARKGEAMPAVDAQAHAGVDIDMRPVRPANSPGAPRNIQQETIESLYPAEPPVNGADSHNNYQTPPRGPRPEHQNGAAEQPAAWTVNTPPPKQRPLVTLRPPRHHDVEQGGRKATVTYRMPAKDFVRLRFAARDLEMSCQALILEALDCYLDANDIPDVSAEECERETERLAKLLRERRARK